jgi:hypothetical protein
MAFYAVSWPNIQSKSMIVSLANELNWSISIQRFGKLPLSYGKTLHKVSDISELQCKSLTWQGLNQLIPIERFPS